MAPWTQLHVVPTGALFTCCMSAEPEFAVGNLRKGDTLETAWNSVAMRALRRAMLRDEPSPACRLCHEGESLGQSTLRTAENWRMAEHYDVVEQTAEDGTVPFLVPSLDIRFSNVCNLRCRICSAKFSSAWHGDAVKLGRATRDSSAVLTASEDPGVLQQIFSLLPTIERIHFAGGEPLMSEEHFLILERLLELGRRDVQLTYNTNFSKLKFRHWDAAAMWREFPRIYMQASLDGEGVRGELMRKGLQWEDAVDNRERLLSECPHIDFVVLATVSVMNAWHLPDFFESWLSKGYIGAGGFQLNILHHPRYLNVRGFPEHLKLRVESRYASFFHVLDTLGAAATRIRRDCDAVRQYMRQEDWDITDDFLRHTKELDVLRDESFASVFPELADFALGDTADGLRTAKALTRFGITDRALVVLEQFLDPVLRGGDATPAPPIAKNEALQLRQQLRIVTQLQRSPFVSRAEEPMRSNNVRNSPGADTAASVSPPRAQEHFWNAKADRARGDLQSALSSLRAAVQSAPEDAIAYLTGRLVELENAGDRMLDHDSGGSPDIFGNPALGYFLRGMARQATGDVAGARADLDRVLALELLLDAARRARSAMEHNRSSGDAIDDARS